MDAAATHRHENLSDQRPERGQGDRAALWLGRHGGCFRQNAGPVCRESGLSPIREGHARAWRRASRSWHFGYGLYVGRKLSGVKERDLE
jgi:hypothetical protein